jgi:hypothetical protein
MLCHKRVHSTNFWSVGNTRRTCVLPQHQTGEFPARHAGLRTGMAGFLVSSVVYVICVGTRPVLNLLCKRTLSDNKVQLSLRNFLRLKTWQTAHAHSKDSNPGKAAVTYGRSRQIQRYHISWKFVGSMRVCVCVRKNRCSLSRRRAWECQSDTTRGHAMAQDDIRRHLVAQTRVRPQAPPYGICGGANCHWDSVFCPVLWVLRVLFHRCPWLSHRHFMSNGWPR